MFPIEAIRKRLVNRWNSAEQYRPILDGWTGALLFYVVPPEMGARTPTCRFRLKNLSFRARFIDLLAVREVALRGEYDFLRDLTTQPDPVILDLGAHIGMFSLLAFSLFPEARCHSYEASPDTFAVLERNRQGHPGLNWSTHNRAVWKQSGVVPFSSTGPTTARRICDLEQRGSEVKSVALIDIVNQIGDVTVCKMDVEGAEEQILESAGEALSRIAHLVIEIHPDFCNEERVMNMLHRSYPYVYRLNRPGSAKPLVLASRIQSNISLALAV